ncbi:NlpC/P60 family protein [Flavobacterium sp.]|uniref:NlpC/P60 family protein n=1 Tax=Flavobacterium sp. TaxID=239 RepID=UPI0040474287
MSNHIYKNIKRTIYMANFKIIVIFFLFVNSFAIAQNNTHKVKKGETIYSITRKYDMSEKALYKLNPKIKGKVLQVNTVLTIQKIIEDDLVETANELAENSETHKVKKGESFATISKKYNISIEELSLLNPKVKSRRLKAGTILQILNKEEKVQEEVIAETNTNQGQNNKKIEHIILPKETKYGVSKRYGISIEALENLNPEIKTNFPVGYVLTIQSSETEASILNEEETLLVNVMSDNFLKKADILVEKASEFIGTRYRSGGTTPNGFDCSGLMLTTFKEIDLTLPRTSGDQANYGDEVRKNKAQKGDLIFFATGRKKSRINHVGMITEVSDGEIKFIHSSTSAGVIISSLNESYYSTRFRQINRVLN